MTIHVEAFNSPYSTKDGDYVLVRGTDDPEEARFYAVEEGFRTGPVVETGRFRKVPNQDSSWSLRPHNPEKDARGSFLAVIFERKGAW